MWKVFVGCLAGLLVVGFIVALPFIIAALSIGATFALILFAVVSYLKHEEEEKKKAAAILAATHSTRADPRQH